MTRHGESWHRGFEKGYTLAQLESEQVRKSLTGWRPFAYVCSGFVAGYFVCWMWPL